MPKLKARGLTRRITRKQALSYEMTPNRSRRRLRFRRNPLGVTAIAALTNGRRRSRFGRVSLRRRPRPNRAVGYSRSYGAGWDHIFGKTAKRSAPKRRKPATKKRRAAAKKPSYARAYAKTRRALGKPKRKQRAAARVRTTKKVVRRAAPKRRSSTQGSKKSMKRRARPNRYKRGKLRGAKLAAWRKKHPQLAGAAAAARKFSTGGRKAAKRRGAAKKPAAARKRATAARKRARKNPGTPAQAVANRRRRRRRATSNLMYENRRRRRHRRAAAPNRRRRHARANLMYENRRRRRSRKNAAVATTPNRRRRRHHAKRNVVAFSNRRRRHARRNVVAFDNRRRFGRRRHARRNDMLGMIREIAKSGAKIAIGFVGHRGLTHLLSTYGFGAVPSVQAALGSWSRVVAGALTALPIIYGAKRFAKGQSAIEIGGGAFASLVHMVIMQTAKSLGAPETVAAALAAYPDATGPAFHTLSSYEVVQPLSSYEMVEPMSGFGSPEFYQAAAGMGGPIVQAAGAYPQLVQAAGEYETVNGVGDSDVVYDGVRPDLHSAEHALSILEASAGLGDIPLVDTSQPRSYETGALPGAPVDEGPGASRSGIFGGGGGIFGP